MTDVTNPDRRPDAGGPSLAGTERSSGVLARGGAMGALMRAMDWRATPLGPVEQWPQGLRSAVSIMLNSRYPIAVYWGRDLALLYNDAWSPIPGTKHPWALARGAREVWPEIWSTIGPLFDRVLTTGDGTWSEDELLPMHRHGYTEECYFNFTFSPILGDAGEVEGVFNAVVETTFRVIGERRTRVLRDLGARAAEAKTAEDACRVVVETLAQHGYDVPFALVYLLDAGGTRLDLEGAVGVNAGSRAAPRVVDVGANGNAPWPFADVVRDGRAAAVHDVSERVGPLLAGPWPEPLRDVVVLPLASSARGQQLAGVLVAGASPRLALDEGYLGFLDVAANQVATAIASARAYEQERQRAESLAELDRVKTQFFSNVSHEFRTPLTLMLGPLERALERRAELEPAMVEELALAYRNALRLLKLVNTLLHFSRIEAGRADADFEPTDIAAYTAELASNFRATVESAGMRLVVDTPPLPADLRRVFVDREMWEKVILNLLSNAFKHTFEGDITVRVRAESDHVAISVADTGVGIPADQLPHIFERFHRVPNARSRTHEGTGIGLALVQELVKLHGGRIDVESTQGAGTTFTVRLPLGGSAAAAPRDETRQPATASLGAAPYIEEAQRWVPGAGARFPTDGVPRDRAATPSADLPAVGAHILVADDNADMRAYVTHLLGRQWSVEAVADGVAALAAIRERPPELVLADVMMPGLDGFQLLRELRADERTREIPVILLSARAGEEARVEGLNAGADDYLVKPFNARELLARLGATLQLTRLRKAAETARREGEERFRALVTASSDVVYRMSPDWTEMRHLEGRDFIADTVDPTRTWMDRYIHPDDKQLVMASIAEAVRTQSIFQLEHRVLRVDGTVGWTFSRAIPLFGHDGEIIEWFGTATDVTARKEADRERERLFAEAQSARADADAARIEAETANLAKSDFLAAMSHELRTPLNAIAGHTQLIELGIHGPVTEPQREALGRIQRAEQHLLSLINDVLNFAKLEAGRVEYDVERVPLADAVAEVRSMLDPQLQAKLLSCDANVSPHDVARADREKVRQVLLNLISNAIKFTPSGGRITIDTATRADAPPGMIYLRVSDTGIGIPREKQESVFDPFVQVHRKLTSSTEGTGLGLAISRDLARGMRGDLRVRSEEGRGSTFTLALPREESGD